MQDSIVFDAQDSLQLRNLLAKKPTTQPTDLEILLKIFLLLRALVLAVYHSITTVICDTDTLERSRTYSSLTKPSILFQQTENNNCNFSLAGGLQSPLSSDFHVSCIAPCSDEAARPAGPVAAQDGLPRPWVIWAVLG